MHLVLSKPIVLVSPKIYVKILANPHLFGALFPDGSLSSPYEILDYDSVLTLEDPFGMRATIDRTQEIRFLQDGVEALLDHCWGDGVLTGYSNDAGTIGQTFSDAGRRHLVIELKRPMKRGETLKFKTTRSVVAGFTQDREWLETTLDHPASRMQRSIVFPTKRQCKEAVLIHDGRQHTLSPASASGRTILRYEVLNPAPGNPSTLVWRW